MSSTIQCVALRFIELSRILPQPIHAPALSDDESEAQRPALTQAIVTRPVVPPYGQRRGWKPSSQDDFGVCSSRNFMNCLTKFSGDGGSFPECHVAQYPLGMGKQKVCLA